MSQDRSSQDRSSQDMLSQDRSSQVSLSQDRLSQNRSSKDRSSQDRSGQVHLRMEFDSGVGPTCIHIYFILHHTYRHIFVCSIIKMHKGLYNRDILLVHILVSQLCNFH